jgi:hypothetical protein
MTTMWAQLVAGMLAVVALFSGAALGGALLACTPLRRPAATACRASARR